MVVSTHVSPLWVYLLAKCMSLGNVFKPFAHLIELFVWLGFAEIWEDWGVFGLFVFRCLFSISGINSLSDTCKYVHSLESSHLTPWTVSFAVQRCFGLCFSLMQSICLFLLSLPMLLGSHTKQPLPRSMSSFFPVSSSSSVSSKPEVTSWIHFDFCIRCESGRSSVLFCTTH